MLRQLVRCQQRVSLTSRQTFRGYARSRFPDSDAVGFGRARRPTSRPSSRGPRATPDKDQHRLPEQSQFWHESMRAPTSDPETGLQALLNEEEIVVTRCVVYSTFDAHFLCATQAARNAQYIYRLRAEQSICHLSVVSFRSGRIVCRLHQLEANTNGEALGFIAEESEETSSFVPWSREVVRRAVIMDRDGTPVLWVSCAGYRTLDHVFQPPRHRIS